MSVLIEFTTITLEDADGNNVELSIDALDSSIPLGGETKVRVFTNPISYLDKVVMSLTNGSLSSEGIKTNKMVDEEISLEKSGEDEYAKGALSQVPSSTPSYSVLADIGGGSTVSFSGKDAVADNLNTEALIIKATYDYKFKQYNFKAPNSSNTSIVKIGAKLYV